MSYTLAAVFTFSIAIAAIIGGIRFRKIDPAYYPFIFCIWLALGNEILGFIFSHIRHSNAVNNNIYVLLESLLFTWQFQKWGLFKRVRPLFPMILGAFVIFWIIEGLFFGKIYHTISYFRIFYSSVIVMMSINILNEKLMTEKKNILKNPAFLICLGFVLYYTYKIITSIFWLYGLGGSRSFRMNVVWIMIYINLVTNLVYAIAVLCIPAKHRFSLRS
jgi:hypothetical protein